MFTGGTRPIRTAAITTLFFLATAASAAAEDKGPGDFLVALSQRAIAELSDQGIGDAERQERFGDLLEANFDMRAIGRFVIGVYARRATAEDQTAFLAAFKDVLAQRFLPYFRDYRGEAFAVDEVRADPTNPRLSLVISSLTLANGNDLPVGWRIRRSKAGFKIIDVVAEGVSLAITFRSEYTAVLKRSNGDLRGLTRALQTTLVSGGFASQRE